MKINPEDFWKNVISKGGLPMHTFINKRYRIDDVLKNDSYGYTYLCTDIEKNIKVILWEYVDTRYTQGYGHVNGQVNILPKFESKFQEECEKYMDEGKRLKSLGKMPGILSCYDCFQYNNTVCLVFEYVHGVNLEAHVRNSGGCISPHEILTIMCPVIQNLGKVHKAGVIHKCIFSPKNIIVDDQGLGTLIKTETFSHQNDEGQILYTETEFFYSEFRNRVHYKDAAACFKMKMQMKYGFDYWTDVCGICAVMHYAMTGEYPEKGPAYCPSELGIDIDAGVEEAIMRGFIGEPEKRYPSMEEFALALYG